MKASRNIRVGRTTRLLRWPFLWGPVDQLVSSATNFALSVVAGRRLGPGGLGVVFVGFSAYLVVLGFQRALVTEPLTVVSTADDPGERLKATRSALTVSLTASCTAALCLGLIGASGSGPVARGLLAFSPWVVPALAQDFFRAVLFRDGRGSAAAANDGAWMLFMLVATPLALAAKSEWLVVAWWGVGATAAALVGAAQVAVRPQSPLAALRWWRARAWLLGRWLWLESLMFYLGHQGVVFVLAKVVGVRSLGGLRAIESIFAPMSFLKPAVELPGLPALSRSLRRSQAQGRALAVKLSGAAGAAALAYFLSLAAAGVAVVELVFGRSFRGFSDLILPVGVGQIAWAMGLGFTLQLKAQGRGRAVVLSGAIASASALVLAPTLGAGAGILGAAWGVAAAGVAGAFVAVLLAVLPSRGVIEEEVLPAPPGHGTD